MYIHNKHYKNISDSDNEFISFLKKEVCCPTLYIKTNPTGKQNNLYKISCRDSNFKLLITS